MKSQFSDPTSQINLSSFPNDASQSAPKEVVSKKFQIAQAFLYLFIFLGVCLRIYTAFQHPPSNHIWSDPGRHYKFGSDPFTTDFMSGIDPVLYQVFLSIILRFTHESPLAIAIYAALLSSITPWFWYRFLRELIPNKLICLSGWLVLTWLPSWIGIYSYLMNETLLLPLLGLALWNTFKSARKQNNSSWFWFCLSWILACLTRVVALPMFLISLIYMFKAQFIDSSDKLKTKLQKVFVLFGLLIIFLLPAAYRTHHLIGLWAPFGSPLMNQVYMQSGKQVLQIEVQGKGFWEFGSPSLFKNPFEGLNQNWKSQRSGTVSFFVNPNKGATDWKGALQNSWPGWKQYLRMTYENVIFLLFSSSWTDDNPEHFIENLNTQMRWLWAPLLFLVTVFNIIYFLKKKNFPLLPCLVMFSWAVCMFSPAGIMEGRYRKPLEGLLIVNLLWLISKRNSLKEVESNVVPVN